MRENSKVRVGTVVSNKMMKTVIVAVEQRAMDKQFKKFMKSVNRFKVHDEKSECQVGDRVQMIETSPISKDKRWRVQKVLTKAIAAE